MKNILYFAIFFTLSTKSLFAQNWEATGPDDFKQISSPQVSYSRVFTDTLGNAYITYLDSFANNNYQRLTIKKETPNGWVKIASVLDTNSNVKYTQSVDKLGNFYYAKDTMMGGTAHILLKKFDGMAWTTLSTYPTTLNSSLYLNMKLLHNETPYIIYQGKTNSVFPTMIKWNGTNMVAIGGAIANTGPYLILFDFDSNDTPHVLYYDALTTSYLIKKFDGSNWVTLNITGTPGSDFRIINDTMYVSGGTSGYSGGAGWGTATTTLKKYNGSNWVNVVNYSNPFLVPSAPSTKIIFDSTGNIYLANGTILKVTGTTAVPIGTQGDLALKNNDTLYATYNEDYFGGKISLRKKINNVWVEDYPLSIAPFRGGYLSTYYIYNRQPFHYFFADKNSVPNLFSQATVNDGAFAKYTNSTWTNISAPVTPSSYPSSLVRPYMLANDTSNNAYFMAQNDPHLQKFDGSTWTSIGGSINSNFSYGSFVIDRNNIPYVAFVDNSTFGGKRVRVKKYDGTNWVDVSTTMPFLSTGISENPLIACDTANNISVLLKDGINLYVTKFDGTNWNTVGTVIGSANSSDYSFALTEAGDPIVASLSVSTIQKPVVHKFNGTNWVVLGVPYFSYGNSKGLNLLVDKDTVYLTYTDQTLNKAVVTKFNGSYFGALGSQNISRDASSNPMLIKSGNDIYVSFSSDGLFVKKLTNAIILPVFNCPIPNAAATSITDTTAFLSWLPNATVGYLYGISSSNSLPTNISFSTTNSYTATSLQPNTTYYFFIRNVCGIDSSSWDTVSFTTSNITEVPTLSSQQTSIKAYPNPFTNKISLHGLKPKDKILLSDISGRVIQSWEATDLETQTFNTTNVAAGYYVLKIITKQGTVGISMIKNQP